MSSEKHCCVPGCSRNSDSRTVLHCFPNPAKDIDRFMTWVFNISGDIVALNNENIYKHRRVCHAHFETRYCCRYNRLSNIAVPTLNMPETPMHRFPDRVKFPERFKMWVSFVGGKLDTEDDYDFYNNKRLCDIHFEDKFKVRNQRVGSNAIPTIKAMSGKSESSVIVDVRRNAPETETPPPENIDNVSDFEMIEEHLEPFEDVEHWDAIGNEEYLDPSDNEEHLDAIEEHIEPFDNEEHLEPIVNEEHLDPIENEENLEPMEVDHLEPFKNEEHIDPIENEAHLAPTEVEDHCETLESDDLYIEVPVFCQGCLSKGRDLYIMKNPQELDIFRMIMSDFTENDANNSSEEVSNPVQASEHFMCWECIALFKKFALFKLKVQKAQKFIRDLALKENVNLTDSTSSASKSLSNLNSVTKLTYDKTYMEAVLKKHVQIYIETPTKPAPPQLVPSKPALPAQNSPVSHVTQATKDDVNDQKPVTKLVKNQLRRTATTTETRNKAASIDSSTDEYLQHYITETKLANLTESRRLAKLKPEYANARYKCVMCITGYDKLEHLEEHIRTIHCPTKGEVACSICYKHMDSVKLKSHKAEHYTKFTCRHCSHVEFTAQEIRNHVRTQHFDNIDGNTTVKVKAKEDGSEYSGIGELFPFPRKTLTEYICKYCDQIFKNVRKWKTHVLMYHSEGVTCDHCKKRFVTKLKLIKHMKYWCRVLHSDPMPREKCLVCNKMVRVVFIEKHKQRHFDTIEYQCKACDKVFSNSSNYREHVRNSHAHATKSKQPCPESIKILKQEIQERYNYRHLEKPLYKCPVCNKSKKKLLEQEKCHEADMMMECVCESTFHTKSGIGKHMRDHEQPNTSINKSEQQLTRKQDQIEENVTVQYITTESHNVMGNIMFL